MHHDLKTWPIYFQQIACGMLPFSVRDNMGRGFQKGDTVTLQEYDPDTKQFTGQELQNIEVTYVESSWGVSPGHVVIGFGGDGHMVQNVKTGESYSLGPA